jgi:hypothetical protein
VWLGMPPAKPKRKVVDCLGRVVKSTKHPDKGEDAGKNHQTAAEELPSAACHDHA